MRGAVQTAAAVIACGALAGCGDSPQAPPPVVPGVVDVMVTLANAQDQAILITTGAGIDNFTPASGIEAFHNPGQSPGRLLLVASAPMSAGEVRAGTFSVPDTSAIRTLTMSISEIARADYQLRESLAGYTVRLVKR